MSSLLDVIGSIVIGSTFMLLVFQFNINTSEAAYVMNMQNTTSMDAAALCAIIENDFYKTGYRIPGSVITRADSNIFHFYTDYDDDSFADSLYYSIGDTSVLSSTTNPNDRPIYRQYNSGALELIGSIREFRMSYLDSTGAALTGLNLQSNRDKIRGLEVYFLSESGETLDSAYQFVEWKRIIYPPNIN